MRGKQKQLPKFSKKIYDNVHGYIDISKEEQAIIDTPIVQRLRRIAHLGLASLVYPGATHSRFSHAIGSIYVMNQLSSILLEKGAIEAEDTKLLRLAALLHDVGHYPLSHVYDNAMKDEFEEQASHENLSRFIIQHTSLRRLIRHACDIDRLDALFGKQQRPSLFQYIISSSLDVDKLDYLQRDSLHTGVAYGAFDVERLLRCITVDDIARPSHLVVEERGRQAIEDFLIGRFHMFQSVYFHKAVVSFETMMQSVCRDLLRKGILPSYSQLLSKITRDERFLCDFDDSYLWSAMKQVAKKSSATARLVQMIFHRQDLKMADESLTLGPGGLPPIIRQFGEDIAAGISRKAGLRPGDVFVVPYPRVTFLDDDEPRTVYVESRMSDKPIPIAKDERSIVGKLARDRLDGYRVYAITESAKKKVERVLRT